LDFYFKKRRWKILLFLAAIAIAMGSFYYTNWLISRMAIEERKNVELWADATRKIAGYDVMSSEDMTFLSSILERNTTIPIILTDSIGEIITDKNIAYEPNRKQQILERELRHMKDENAPIIVDTGIEKQYLYYRDSYLLRNLKYYPIVQFAVIVLFIMVSYFAFSSSRKAEQNQVWVGMSKETAHQLGTPISSLMAWVELLKMQNIDESLIREFEKDTQRLEKITERFSKIGSMPELVKTDVAESIRNTISYLKTRSSDKVKFVEDFTPDAVCFAPLNASLFSWVIENLCKNAIDAMDNHGSITISIHEKPNQLQIDVTDTGKGIPKSFQKSVFNPGFTTKKRGWGLGLSLAKRIIENYHRGKIVLKHSEIGKGTTFRITLRK
jgi:K+-sensing histidine kinase KdpD